MSETYNISYSRLELPRRIFYLSVSKKGGGGTDVGDPHRIPVAANPCNFYMEIKSVEILKTGIGGIHAIPINLKSPHSGFPVETL